MPVMLGLLRIILGTILMALGLLGLCIGSFLNVVVHRKPQRLEREWLGEIGRAHV